MLGIVINTTYIHACLSVRVLIYVCMCVDLCQLRNEDPGLAKGAAKAVFELYEVVTHDLLSSDLRFMIYFALISIWPCNSFFEIPKVFFLFIYFSVNVTGSSLIHGTF